MTSASPQLSQADCRDDAKQRLLRVREQLQRLCESLDEEIRKLDGQAPELPAAPAQTLISSAAAKETLPTVLAKVQSVVSHSTTECVETCVISPTTAQPIEPDLEQQTLSELNWALNMAFREITERAAA